MNVNNCLRKTFAYVKRDTLLGDRIMGQLKPTESTLTTSATQNKIMSVIAQLRFNEENDQSNQVELLDIIEDHWY